MSDNILPANTDTCLVEFDKKEYAIVGDSFFAKTLEEVPPWFQNLIQDKVSQANVPMRDMLTQYNLNLLAALQGLDIAKNTYEQYIYKVLTDSEAYVASLTTLNSTIAGNDASIRQLLSTYATKDFAVASAAQLLTASLNGGAIGAKIGSVESAMATQYGAMAQRLQILEAEYTNSISDLYGKAQAMEAVAAFVGANNDGSTTSLAYKVSKLNSYLTDATTGEMFGGVEQNLGGYTEVTAKDAADAAVVDIYSKYSKILVGGKEYINGFGLFANYNGTTGGSSTFWVAADQFKLYDARTLDSTNTQTQTVFTNDGNPIEVVTGITGGVVPFKIENGVTYLQNAVIGWGDVAGAGKPQDGATKNMIHYSNGVPSNSFGSNGDIYVDQETSPTTSYVKYNGVWIKSGNVITGTDQITDTAGLGTKATWNGVTGTGKPSDYADVTSVKITDSATIQAVKNSSSWSTLIESLAAGNITLAQVVQNDGELTSGSIQSSNYSAGSGWKIDHDGNAVFNTLFVRNLGGTGQTNISIGETTKTSASGDGTVNTSSTGPTMFLLVGRTGFTGANAISSKRKIEFTANGVTHDTGVSPFIGDYFVAAVVTATTSKSVSVSATVTASSLATGDKWSMTARVVAITLASSAKVVN